MQVVVDRRARRVVPPTFHDTALIAPTSLATVQVQNPPVSRADLLMTTMEEAYARLRSRVEGISDEEFFWRPTAETWTIYEDRPGRWTYHYAIPGP